MFPVLLFATGLFPILFLLCVDQSLNCQGFTKLPKLALICFVS